MEYTVSGANIVVLAVTVWFVGTYINSQVPFLQRYSIPVAVTGGLLCSLVVTAVYYGFDVKISFDTRLRDLLLLVFFSTIGLSAKFRSLKEGGMALVILLAAATVLLILQDTTGVLLAIAFGAHPGYGLFGGSVSLAGGHGTAIAWGDVAVQAGLENAKEIGIAFATFGLVAGGLIGGPIAERLIKKNGIQHVPAPAADGAVADTSKNDEKRQLPALSTTLGTLMIIAACVEAGDLVNQFLFSRGVTLPGFLTAMLIGIIITNSADALKIELDTVSQERAAELSLQLFLAISLMSMQLWVLAGAVGKILLILFVQMIVITLFSVWIVFRVMGRDYDAAVIAAGFAGLGMGATPVGIANMNAITSKYGPSPKAFLIIPLVGAFFLDLVNALVIKTFIALPFMQASAP